MANAMADMNGFPWASFRGGILRVLAGKKNPAEAGFFFWSLRK